MKRDEKNNRTEAWVKYELGRAYNNRLIPNQYNLVNANVEFFSGNQWLHMPDTPAMSRLMRPVFNIIKRVCSLFVSSITSSNTTITFEPLTYYDGENLEDPESNASTYATAEVRNLFDKFKMEYRIREALFDGAITGDYCAHFYWDPEAMPYGGAFGGYKGEIKMELVDGINVMFGNPNTTDVQSQPYILIIGRDTVENLQWEADRFRKQRNKNGGKAGEIFESVTADNEYQWQSGIGGQTEIVGDDEKTGKALYVYMYTKVKNEEVMTDSEGKPVMETVTDADGNPIQEVIDGQPLIDEEGNPVYKTRVVKKIVESVHVTKATRDVVIFEDVDTGLGMYPIAWGNWERQKNQYHGRALVTGIIPNQIFINSMMALAFKHQQLMSFPKTVYNADLLTEWSNEVGVAIGIHNMQPNQDVRTIANVLQPADMSNQIVLMIDKVMQYTKECLGATDAQLGNIHPDNTSALMVLQSSSEVPLENTRACLYEWVEDIGAILLDMMGTYYGNRPVVRERTMQEFLLGPDGAPQIDPMTGQMMTRSEIRKVVEEFDFNQFKHLYFNTRVDVGSTTYYSEIAMVQTLDNLRRDGTLEIIDYLERIPDKLIPRKDDLIRNIKERTAQVASQTTSLEDMDMPGQQGPQGPKDAGAPAMGGMLDADKAVSNLPSTIQAKYNSLPKEAQKALVGKASM